MYSVRDIWKRIAGFLKSLGSAIRDGWKQLLSGMDGSTEYDLVFLSATDSEHRRVHLTQMARKFSGRARVLKRIAVGLLLAVATLIVVGMLVFLMPTRFSDATSPETIVLDATKQKADVGRQQATAIVEYLAARDKYYVYAILRDCQLRLAALRTNSESLMGNPSAESRIQLGLAVCRALPPPDDLERTFKVRHLQGFDRTTDTVSITSQTFELVARDLLNHGVSPKDLVAEFLWLKEKIYLGDVDHQRSAIDRVTNSLRETEELYKAAKDEKEDLYARLDQAKRDSLAIQEQVIEAETKIANAVLEINQLQTNWRNSPVFTTLAIRIGIVVLLLYLTSIILATYRYTMSLAAFYQTRVDAIQLLSSQPVDRLFDAGEFGQLVAHLSADRFQIDPVAAPYDNIVKSGI